MKKRITKRKIIKKQRRTFKRSHIKSRRSHVMRGGNALFPASFTNTIAAGSPQSYLPYNTFTEDPGYNVIASRNTGPFLTGVASGGSKKNRRRGRRVLGGGSDVTNYLSNSMNTGTNSIGVIPSPAFNESSGIAGIMSNFSNIGSAYSSTPLRIVPLA